MTPLNIRSDPMATRECAKQVQASPQLLGKRNACALLKKNFETESLAQTWNVMQIVKSLKFQVGIISLDSQDPRILEMGKKSSLRPYNWTIYQELCQLIIRAVQSLLCWIMWRSLSKDLAYMQAYEILIEPGSTTFIQSFGWLQKSMVICNKRNIQDKISSFWRLGGMEGNWQWPDRKTQIPGIFSSTFKVGTHQNHQSTYNETLCLNEKVMFHQYHMGKRHPCCDITSV